MNYCETCRNKLEWASSVHSVDGPCEICGAEVLCYQRPENMLKFPDDTDRFKQIGTIEFKDPVMDSEQRLCLYWDNVCNASIGIDESHVAQESFFHHPYLAELIHYDNYKAFV